MKQCKYFFTSLELGSVADTVHSDKINKWIASLEEEEIILQWTSYISDKYFVTEIIYEDEDVFPTSYLN
jgi:hypothetical protein